MSRIYQGGSADRRYQSKAQSRSYNPISATDNSKAIREEGEQILQNLETINRERQRNDEMSNLETSYSAKAAQLDLRLEQEAEAGQLKLAQLKQKADLGMSQLKDKNALKVEQTFARSSLELNQAVTRSNLATKQSYQKGKIALNQTVAKNNLAARQTAAKNQLSMNQTAQKANFASKQSTQKARFDQQSLSQKQELERDQMLANQTLEAAQSEENFLLGVDMRGQQAQFALDRAQLQAEQAVQRADSQLMQTAVSSLINFGQAVYGEVQRQEAVAEQKALQREQSGIDLLLSDQSSPTSPTTQAVVQNQADVQTAEVAVESAIQTQSSGNPIEAENIRQPMADATMDRNLRQASIGEAAINFRPEYDRLIGDPSTTIEVNGEMRTLASINNRADLNTWLVGAARQLTSEFGVDGKEAHAMLMQYAGKAKGSIAAAYSSLAPQVAAAAKQERYDAGLSNAETLMQTGNHQTAWETARNAYITSGQAMGKSNRQINDAVFQDLVSRAQDPQALASVLKTGQPGTEFGAQRDYAEMIKKETISRLNLETSGYRAAQNNTNMQIDQITQSTDAALMVTEDPEESYQIRQQAIAQLSELGPLALDDINRLSAEGKTNNNVRLALQEAFDYGNPPSTQEIADAYTSGAITLEQKNEFMKMGMRSDEVNMAISKAGLPPVQKQLEATVTQALASAGVDSTERKGMAAGIVANQLPHVEAELKQFVISNPEATGAEIQKEAARIMSDVGLEIYNKKGIDGSRLQKQGNGQFTYDYDTSRVAPVTERRNPTTGKAQRVYIQHDAADVPAGASVNDAYLSRDEFLKAVEVWDAGRQTYSTRIKELSRKLGVSPTSFVRHQATALGYPSIEVVPQAVQKQDVPPTNMQAGFAALQSMDFPIRGAAYLAGNIMQESSWDGARSWGEVQGDGSDRNGGLVSWMDGVAHNNFRLTKIEEYLGKPIDQASTAEQLQAMKWEMQRDYPDAYRVFMNPNATDVQLRRASRMYWGYGHEGNRYSYAQQLLS
jgi:hypothetical protein